MAPNSLRKRIACNNPLTTNTTISFTLTMKKRQNGHKLQIFYGKNCKKLYNFCIIYRHSVFVLFHSRINSLPVIFLAVTWNQFIIKLIIQIIMINYYQRKNKLGRVIDGGEQFSWQLTSETGVDPSLVGSRFKRVKFS